MSVTKIPPRLRVSETLSHPVDPAAVIGFRGRNVLLGVDSLVLKAEMLPVIRDNPSVTHFILPEKEATEVERDGLHVYILDKDDVYHVTPVQVEDGLVHTGKKYGENVTGRKIAVEDLETWPRGAVEVTN